MAATAAPTKKELREDRKAIKEKREALFPELRSLHDKCKEFNAVAKDKRDEAWKENFDNTAGELEELSSEVVRLGHEQTLIEEQLKALGGDPLGQILGSDGAALSDSLDDQGLGRLDLEFRKNMADVKFRTGPRGGMAGMNLSSHTAQVPVAPGSTDTQDVDLRMLSHPKYEELWGQYVQQLAMPGGDKTKFDPVAEFTKSFSADGMPPSVGQGVVPCPMRLLRLMACNCEQSVFMFRYANVVPVNNACKLGIVKRKDRVRSAQWGCECVEPPKSGLPGLQEKEMQPHLWTQGATTCRALLRCVLVNPVDMLMDDMAWDQRLFLEEGLMFGNGKDQPLGLFADEELGVAPITQEDYDSPEKLVDALREILCAIPFECLTSRSNVWVLSHAIWCKLMAAKDCCGRSLWFREGQSSFADTPWNATLFGFPIEVVSQGFAEQMSTRPFAFGDLSTYTIATFPFGTGLESDVDIKCDRICWVKREYIDGMPICNNSICIGKVVTPEAKEALLAAKAEAKFALG